VTAEGVSEAFSAEPALSMGRRELEALQLERLRATLHHAYANNCAYRKSFEARGVRPDDLHSLADLARFPFTTKADLRAAYPFDFFAVPLERVARIHASSGTTGKPTVVGYTKNDIATWSHLVARSIRAAGGRCGMRVHVG
jgi:phenylacetate-CoA ligase